MSSIKQISIAILVYCDVRSIRNALTEEKYRDLCTAFHSEGFIVESVSYNDEQIHDLKKRLSEFDVVLVWVNPVEQGNDRRQLDTMLRELSASGCLVSTHPDTILKMGTKDILFKTRDSDWGSDTRMYTTFEDFTKYFPGVLRSYGQRVLKQHRGNGGNGVFKIDLVTENEIRVTHAISGNESRTVNKNEFLKEWKSIFENNGLIIDQEWNNNSTNGMVRCYVSGKKVAGFGYQEINALYELDSNGKTFLPPGKRYYYTENCGLFKDLKDVMETKWIPELQRSLEIENELMPVIWDADFFINKINSPTPVGKYILCEINVSCVSPFPPSAIKFIISEVKNRIRKLRGFAI